MGSDRQMGRRRSNRRDRLPNDLGVAFLRLYWHVFDSTKKSSSFPAASSCVCHDLSCSIIFLLHGWQCYLWQQRNNKVVTNTRCRNIPEALLLSRVPSLFAYVRLL